MVLLYKGEDDGVPAYFMGCQEYLMWWYMCEFFADLRCYHKCYGIQSKRGPYFACSCKPRLESTGGRKESVLVSGWSGTQAWLQSSSVACGQKFEWNFRSCMGTTVVGKLFGIAFQSLSGNKPFLKFPCQGPDPWRRLEGHVASAAWGGGCRALRSVKCVWSDSRLRT